MSIKVIGIFLPGVVVLLALSLFIPLRSDHHTVIQPINYNHKIHVESAGLNCVDCHLYVEKLASASIPPREVCETCHSETALSDSPEEAKLLAYLAEGKEVPWKKVTHVPDHVFFSHRRHVVGGEVLCSDCHGNVGELTTALVRPQVSLSMDDCMDCHRKRNVNNDCLSCHR